MADQWYYQTGGQPGASHPIPPPILESGARANDESEKPERIGSVTWVAIIVGAGTVLLLLWVVVFRGGSAPQQQAEKHQPLLELADLAELMGPSVVQVNVTGPEGEATGSGFVLDKQGTIVTNFHVIEDATAGRIVFSDRASAPITGYLGAWPEKDIALVRVECPPEKLHPLRLATSAPRQGERVAAFGSPLGLQKSMSEGIVSAVRESDELRTFGPIDVNARLIQTTTPISHGNSGGPLVDMKGLVVGVNTMTLRPLGGENVNFAVAVVELPPLLLAKCETASPLPASDPRILSRASAHMGGGNAAAVTAASLATAVQTANDALAAVEAGKNETKEARQQLFTDLYLAVADAGRVISHLDPADADVADPLAQLKRLHAELVSQPGKVSAFSFLGRTHFPERKAGEGFAAAGTVSEFRVAGSVFETTLDAGSGVQIPVVSLGNPQDFCQIGDQLLAAGRIVEEPAKNIRGYQGDAERVMLLGDSVVVPK